MKQIDVEKTKGKMVRLKAQHGGIIDTEILVSDGSVVVIDKKHNTRTRVSFITGETKVERID